MAFNRRTVAVLGGVGLALAGGSAASAGGETGNGAQADAAEIVMKLDGRKLKFTGPREVVAGEDLKIRNATAVRTIGPHTFSLVNEGRLPKTRRARKNCFAPRRICRKAAVAHEANLRTGEVSRPLVEVGAEGWDRSFSKTARGDSWYTERKGETFSQAVSAAPGTTLHYFCVIHPGMQGEIDVVAGATP